MKKGVPVSPGVAVARTYCVDATLARCEPTRLDAAALSGELLRFERACAAAAEELDAIVARVSRQVGEEEAAIFRGHRLLLRDPALMGKVQSIILDRHFDACGALQCGFCQSGMMLSAAALLEQNPSPTRDEIKQALSGNLCRCTGYTQILDAVEVACGLRQVK